jgi:hypothetical protein
MNFPIRTRVPPIVSEQPQIPINRNDLLAARQHTAQRTSDLEAMHFAILLVSLLPDKNATVAGGVWF